MGVFPHITIHNFSINPLINLSINPSIPPFFLLVTGQWREMTASEIGKLKDSCEPARSTATTTYPSRQQRGDGDRFRGGGGRGGVGGRFGGGGVGGRQSRVFGLGRGRGGGRESGRGGRGLGRSFATRAPGSGE